MIKSITNAFETHPATVGESYWEHFGFAGRTGFILLKAAGAALCIADAGGKADAPDVATADWGYLRLRRTDYSDKDLAGWADRVRSHDWSDAFVFFKHEDDAAGPAFAKRFLELTGE